MSCKGLWNHVCYVCMLCQVRILRNMVYVYCVWSVRTLVPGDCVGAQTYCLLELNMLCDCVAAQIGVGGSQY